MIQITFLATLVAAEAAIKGFQFLMNSFDMSIQIIFLATLVAAKAAIKWFQFFMKDFDMLTQMGTT